MIVAPDFPDHWKTRTLIALAGDEGAIRCLLRFWAHCQQRQRWVFKGLTPQKLAIICNWEGDPETWWSAMVQTFIEHDGDTVLAHDWEQVNATLVGRWKGGSTTRERSLAKAKPTRSASQNDSDKIREEKIGEDAPLRGAAGGASAIDSEEITDQAEAKRLICELVFRGEKNPGRAWSYAAEQSLDRILPLPLAEIKIVAWFHGLEPDDGVHELKVRRRSETSLLENWSDEVTRAQWYRKKIGGGMPPAPAKKEPPFWREFFRWYHENAEIVLPESFWKLTPAQRQNYQQNFAKFSQEREAVA